MALILLTRDTPLPATEAWRRITSWERHGGAVPLTRVTVRTPPPTRVGTVFVARTGLGRAAFDDPMEVVTWQPPHDSSPGVCRLEKRGTFVTGWAEVEVHPGGDGCRVVWREELRVRLVPAVFDVPLAMAGRLVFGRAVERVLRGW